MSVGSKGSASFDPKIILVDDELMCIKSMEFTLKSAGFYSIYPCEDGGKLFELIEAKGCDLVILDIMMPGISGTDLFKEIKKRYPYISVIMVTGVEDVDIVVDCMKNGARDYILKPIEPIRFIASVKNSLEMRELIMENQALSESLLSEELKNPDIFSSIITCNEKMYANFRYIEAIAPTNHSVLVIGETGVGKELFARAIHDASGRKGEFVAVNAAGLDDAVFTDTLFGHVKGSFTGAEGVRKGLIEKARGGTLFLDEIGDLSMPSQVKLLRLLQEKEYMSIGSDVLKKAEIRIIAATCKSIDELENSDVFRKDLYFRLKTHYINIPPLRERKGDLKVLFNHFLEKAAEESSIIVPQVAKQIYRILENYNFGGNVRELEGMVNDALSRAEGGALSISYFKEIIPDVEDIADSMTSIEKSSADDIIFPENLPTLKECSKLLIDEALSRTEGNLSNAADLLGITRQALGQRLNKKK